MVVLWLVSFCHFDEVEFTSGIRQRLAKFCCGVSSVILVPRNDKIVQITIKTIGCVKLDKKTYYANLVYFI
ncbi:hypothetical protein GCM10022250_44550 [Flavobacterium chungbukense]|uniref:Uncharacterized protein n=1 Tax=Flavobacterium chungbukense TaxID=877464 RepID=A0ABP7YW67_9FLAO